MTGALYFIEEEGSDLMKIGYSKDPISRLHSMQSANPARLVMRGMVNASPDLEKAIHAAYKGIRVRGEWYRAEDAMAIYDDLGEICEDIDPCNISSVVLTAADLR